MERQRAELDMVQVRRAFERAAPTYARAAIVPLEVERRMAEKLDYLKIDPRRILDAGAGAGSGVARLRRRYPAAQVLALDLVPAMLRAARGARTLLERMRVVGRRGRAHWVCADFSRLPLQASSMGMVWSSLALAWVADPFPALREFHRVLVPGGALMFSTYGPDTLKELKEAFATVDTAPHVHPFVDMHDIGDMLVAAGFSAPVMEMEKLEVTYADVGGLARDLKQSGQTCAASARRRGLTTPRAWSRMSVEYDKVRTGDRLPVTVEIVYGHAWRGESRTTADGKQIVRLERQRSPAR
jgi:malonyl-CoA O-methyltransferase